jgi:hypothetical protein
MARAARQDERKAQNDGTHVASRGQSG